MPYQAFIVSHTHWDREWYQTFQEFRIRLVALVDKLLGLLARDPRYRHFMLDGQSIVVEDYLEMRPECEPDIRERVQQGRLLIGPWYVLPDEFLVSPEALIRNLMLGQQVCRRFGEPMSVGYVPDSFGHISQLPQILAGFGVRGAAIWRGVPDLPTEFLWQSPDGTAVLTHYMRDGYGNLAWTPHDPEGFAQMVRQAADSLAPHTTTEAILLMNGMDHVGPSPDLPALMAAADELLADVELVHGTLPQYAAVVHAANPELPTVQGEFRCSQRSNIIPGVLSARMWIKQRNRACETLLEGWAEPFGAFAGLVDWEIGKSVNRSPSYPSTDLPIYQLTRLAWRYLLHNHPHDSICGCSVDQVHEEMRFRFDQVEQIAEEVTRRSLTKLVGHIATRSPKLSDSQEALPAGDLVQPAPYVPIVVFNPTAGSRTDLVQVQVQIPPAWPGYELVDEEGQPLLWQQSGEEKLDFSLLGINHEDLLTRLMQEHPGRVRGQGIVKLTYHEGKAGPLVVGTLSAHGQPSVAQVEAALAEVRRRLRADGKPPRLDVRLAPRTSLTFVAQDVPGHGYRTFFLRPVPARPTPEGEAGALSHALRGANGIENEFYHLESDPLDGSIILRDKITGLVYRGLNRFVDEGDRGDVYNHCPVEQDVVVDEPCQPPLVRLLETGPARQTLEIALRYRPPAGLTASRRARLARRVSIPITTRVSLTAGVRRVDFETTVDNAASDHRLRVCFPTPVKTDFFRTETPFDVVERPLDLPTDTSGWSEQPAPTHPQRTFSDVSDERAGLTLINRGLPEVEARREPGGTTLLLTLLRCVGWLSRADMPVRPGHAGPGLPLPGAQCLGVHTFHYALVPHSGDREGHEWLSALPQAYAFNAPMRAVVANAHDGPLPSATSFLEVSPASVVISAIKLTEACPDHGRRESDGLIVRVWNVAPEPVEARLRLNLPFSRAFLTNLDEQPGEELNPDAGNVIRLFLRPRQVQTVRFAYGKSEEGETGRLAHWERSTHPPVHQFSNLPAYQSTKTGTATLADKATDDYLLLPFDVPPGIGRLTVRYTYTHRVSAALPGGSGNVVDIGVFDPRGAAVFQGQGFRGWSGSGRSEFTIGLTDATPGYLPGPIYPGTWHIILGLYQILPEGCHYRLSIVGQAGEMSLPLEPGRLAAPVLSREGCWYRGDLQSHTHHSDGTGSLADLAAVARAQGLDFVAVTEHNTVSHLPHLAQAGGSDLLLIPGQEITTYYGHANAWGIQDWQEFRCRDDATMARIIDAVHADGALFSVNHPKDNGPPWEYSSSLPFDCVEVWQGLWAFYNCQSLDFWDSLLRRGGRVAAVGGSDKHVAPFTGQLSFYDLATPTTWVYAEELSAAGILAGIRAGHVFISAHPQGPELYLTADADGDGMYEGMMGDELNIAAERSVMLCARVVGGRGLVLRIISSGELKTAPVKSADFALRWRARPKDDTFYRLELVEPGGEEGARNPAAMVRRALSNPIYVTIS